MTLRSPKQHPKSSTFSRRLRSRADQGLCVQPPELPHSRPPAPHRAALLASTRHISGSYPSKEAQTIWDPTPDIDSFTRSNTALPSGFTHNQPSDLLVSHLSDPLTFQPHQPPTEVVPTSSQLEHCQYAAADTELLPSPLPSLSGSYSAVDFDLDISPEPELQHNPPTGLQEMSTLDYMMRAAPYGGHYGLPPLHSPSYQQELSQPSYPESRNQHPPTSETDSYVTRFTSGPAAQDDHLDHETYSDSRTSHLDQNQYSDSRPPPSSEPYVAAYTSSADDSDVHKYAETRTSLPPTSESYAPPYVANLRGHDDSERSSELPEHRVLPPFQAVHTDSRNPYSSFDPIRVSSTMPGHHGPLSPLHSSPQSYSYPAIHTGVPSSSIHAPPFMVPPIYHPIQDPYHADYPPVSLPYTPIPPSPSASASGNPRVLIKKEKPQCWEHGCNGRTFSTFSNLLRHQREKSGTAAKAQCPKCHAEFTRTTARNGHMSHDKCKPRARKPSDEPVIE